MTDYKQEQKKFRQLTRPKFFPQGTTIKYINRDGEEAEYANGYPYPKMGKPALPQYTKKYTSRAKKLNREQVLKIEEIRHLYALARRGEL